MHFSFRLWHEGLIAKQSSRTAIGQKNIEEVIKAMTAEEKVTLVAGTGMQLPAPESKVLR